MHFAQKSITLYNINVAQFNINPDFFISYRCLKRAVCQRCDLRETELGDQTALLSF